VKDKVLDGQPGAAATRCRTPPRLGDLQGRDRHGTLDRGRIALANGYAAHMAKPVALSRDARGRPGELAAGRQPAAARSGRGA
jgi:hypothetical protein